MAHKFSEDVPESVVRYDPESESPEGAPIRVEFEWTPGQDATGLSGPPENYDPGSPDEFDITSHDFDEATLDRVIDWLDEHWERPDGPDPDDLRDRMIDDRMTGDE